MQPPKQRAPRSLSQALKNIALILLSFTFLPLSTAILCATYARQRGRTSVATRAPHRRTILVTGVGMAKGLALARLFHQAGHKVIGADFSPQACGGRSAALVAYHTLQRPGPREPRAYVDSLIRVIEREGAELWVSCSGVASAVEDGFAKEAVEARTGCKAVQPGVEATRTLHEKGAFMAHTRDVVGLRVPESHLVRSAGDMMKVLEGVSCRSQKAETSRKFIAKSVGMNDQSRGDMTLLPLATARETRAHAARLEALGISNDDPWLLQEYVPGKEYCTHSLVVRGEVRAFAACASSELLMHYVALDDRSPLSLAMLEFTRSQACSFGDDFTGHLSFDFIVKGPQEGAPFQGEVELYPIECNPRAHTAVLLFSDTPDLVDAYMSVLGDERKPKEVPKVITPEQPRRYYWAGHDLVTLALLPTVGILLLQISPVNYVNSLGDFLTHLLLWRDDTWAAWDPLPWWWLYHVYWPLQFWQSLVHGNSWSRVNVSTTKMFECE